ncbi:MFS transporter [soil metagenome]
MNSEGIRKGHKIFYGWWNVLAVGVGLFLGYVPIIGFTFSVFFKPLSQEFNWSRAEISLAFSLSLLVLSFALPLTGRLVDRFGARKVILSSVLFFGLALISFYFLSASLWHLYAIYLALGLVGSGTSPVPYYNVITHWFDKKRGLALGLAMAGAGLSESVMPSLAQALIASVGWRAAYVLIGLIVIAVTIPVVGLFLKERPQSMGLLPDGKMIANFAEEFSAVQGMSGREVWRSGTFWLMCVALFLVSMSLTGCLVHMVPLLTDRGIAARSAAFAVSLIGGASLLGRLGTGYLLDRLFAGNVAACLFCGAALGVLLLWGEIAGGLAFVAAFLVGLGMGAEGDIMAYMVSRYFGLRAYGEVYGYVLAIYTLGAVVGPLLMGINFDLMGSYRLVLVTFSLATLVGAILITQLGPYRIWDAIAEPA